MLANVTRASPPRICIVSYERDHPALSETICTIWWSSCSSTPPPSTTALEASAGRDLVKDILLCLINRCIAAAAPQAQLDQPLVVRFVDARVQTLLLMHSELGTYTLPLGSLSMGTAVPPTLLTFDSQDVASPLLYSNAKLRTISSLDKFTLRLHTADQLWDSIRRIPYSTPGRWVQSLDLSEIPAAHDSRQAFVIDSLLTTLFPLIPFLENLTLSPALPPSRRALASLTNRDGNSDLRILNGVGYVTTFSSAISIEEDPLVRLLQTCHQIERLEVIGSGMEPPDTELNSQEAVEVPVANVKLELSHLHTLTLLSMPSSSLMRALLSAALPRLKALCLTPYEDIPYPISLTTPFLDVHGNSLSALSLFTPKSWPTRFHPSPHTLLRTCPNLRHLSLETPLPVLAPPDATTDLGQAVLPLQVLSIPRPNHDFWRTLEKLLPSLPSLVVVRMRDVRWLRKGMNRHAQEAGVQGEMRVWRQRLARRGIRLLDGDWKDMA